MTAGPTDPTRPSIPPSSPATFVEGDMYQADFSQTSVLALFLLPSNMLQLRAKFFDLQPGARIVSNTFGIEGWAADQEVTVGDNCTAWCTALLWIVPAKVGGTWRLAQGELVLKQDYQMISGTLGSMPIADSRPRRPDPLHRRRRRVFGSRHRRPHRGRRAQRRVAG